MRYPIGYNHLQKLVMNAILEKTSNNFWYVTDVTSTFVTHIVAN